MVHLPKNTILQLSDFNYAYCLSLFIKQTFAFDGLRWKFLFIKK